MITLLADRSSLKSKRGCWSPPTAASHNKNNKNSPENSLKIKNNVSFYVMICMKIAEVPFNHLLLPWRPAHIHH